MNGVKSLTWTTTLCRYYIVRSVIKSMQASMSVSDCEQPYWILATTANSMGRHTGPWFLSRQSPRSTRLGNGVRPLVSLNSHDPGSPHKTFPTQPDRSCQRTAFFSFKNNNSNVDMQAEEKNLGERFEMSNCREGNYICPIS